MRKSDHFVDSTLRENQTHHKISSLVDGCQYKENEPSAHDPRGLLFVVGTGVGTGVGAFVVGNGVGGFDGSAHSSTLWQSS